ncbi:transcriptional regulator, LacI family (plasmid) [Emticicia oligotrophica DSM 17448]|uniref:Transcriptional regulator, LacI family n=1 Tax=Emticicia oligotrophica (strain DSM 17448 / CIP 109782 / MTCC 6937 / GPTSA100-15) TaxID=929562 RepID=A0ABN4AWK6_EMTOG|nr:LacI family DNA-binding transcriptional regulator [Emticicia oligotrophica]AFK05733.1 transcriptional regulator, LacI family [Emticicia oligotrophica DSM 17448]
MKKGRVKLKDIAEKLNISTATVSRALRNRIEIGAEMREKVKAVAKEMHYQPNFMASHLRSQRNFAIGVVIPKVNHQYMASMINGILEEATDNNFQVIINVTEHSYEKEVKAIEMFSSGIVDGLLICVSNQTKYISHIEQLQQNNIPFVFFDKDIPKIDAPKVVVDDFTGAFVAVEHLIQQGFRNIAHLQDNLVNHGSQKRLKGYYSALKKYGIVKNENFVMQIPNISIGEGRIATENLLRTYPNIDAIFGITDELAVGAIQAAKNLGRKIPEDFGVVGFSNWQISSVVNPTLSTVSQPGNEMGKIATKLLIQRIEDPEKYYEKKPIKILKTQLLVRESSSRLKNCLNY